MKPKKLAFIIPLVPLVRVIWWLFLRGREQWRATWRARQR